MNRLREIREARGLSQKDVAALLHTTDVSISRYETQDQRLTLPLLRRFAEAYGCTVAEIIGERPASVPPRDMGEFALIPVFDARVSAGPGAINEANPEPLHFNAFRLDWLRRVTRASAERLAVLRVQGDSMWQTLHDGDHVLLDLSVGRYIRDGLYVIRYDPDEEYQVKRLSRDPKTRTLTVASDNHDYPTHQGVRDDALEIRGRVIWLGRNLG